MHIVLGTDHAGFEMKNEIKSFLEGLGYAVEDKGAHELDPKDDYPDYINKVAEAVAEDPEDTRGIIFGGSGQGEAIDANRFPHVRATLFYGGNRDIVELSRKHNNANVLSLGARFVTVDEAKEVVQLWLETEFGGEERHVRRIAKIDEQFDRTVFDVWNKQKKKIDALERMFYFHERDVWWCALGKNIGYETFGKGDDFARPVVVLKKYNKHTALVVPLTTSHKKSKYLLRLSGGAQGVTRSANLSQVRLVDVKRFMEHDSVIPKREFKELQKAITKISFQ